MAQTSHLGVAGPERPEHLSLARAGQTLPAPLSLTPARRSSDTVAGAEFGAALFVRQPCRGRSIIRQLMAAMPNEFASPLEVLASATHTSADDWESLDGPDSGVGVDYWYRHRRTGQEAYLNLDQDHLTISVAEQRVYDAEIPDETGSAM